MAEISKNFVLKRTFPSDHGINMKLIIIFSQVIYLLGINIIPTQLPFSLIEFHMPEKEAQKIF